MRFFSNLERNWEESLRRTAIIKRNVAVWNVLAFTTVKTFTGTITFKMKICFKKIFKFSALESIGGAVASTGKGSTRKAFNFSRKYVTLAQAQAQAGMRSTPKAVIAGFQKMPRTIRRRALTGLQIILPLSITIIILVWIFSKIDNILQPLISHILGKNIPGTGLVVIVLLVIISGVIVSTFVGRKVINFGEVVLSKVPIVRQLYYGIKQITDSFTSKDKGNFMQVVLVEFPRAGMRTVGFVTNEAVDQSGKKILNVFIPTAPNPTSGFLQIMTEEEVIRTDISVDDALKMVISAGRVSAKDIANKFGNNSLNITELESKRPEIHVKDKNIGSPV